MTTEQAVKLFIQCHTVQRDTAAKNKVIAAQKESAKGILLDYFAQSKQSFILFDQKYIILKQKTTKPPLNAEFLIGCYRKFQETVMHKQLTDQEAETFARYCFSMQTEMCRHDKDASVSDTRPICAMFE